MEFEDVRGVDWEACFAATTRSLSTALPPHLNTNLCMWVVVRLDRDGKSFFKTFCYSRHALGEAL